MNDKNPVILTLVITEGDAGCGVEIIEFNFGAYVAGESKLSEAVSILGSMIESNCQVIVRRVVRSEANLVTSAQLELAKRIIENGFKFRLRHRRNR